LTCIAEIFTHVVIYQKDNAPLSKKALNAALCKAYRDFSEQGRFKKKHLQRRKKSGFEGCASILNFFALPLHYL
jgi:nucleoid-associated protein YejK